jgi:hypothetical protein
MVPQIHEVDLRDRLNSLSLSIVLLQLDLVACGALRLSAEMLMVCLNCLQNSVRCRFRLKKCQCTAITQRHYQLLLHLFDK